MKIVQSNVSLASQHTSFKESSRSETLRAWIGNQRPDFESTNTREAGTTGGQVSISNAGRQALAAAAQAQTGTAPQPPAVPDAAPTARPDAMADDALNDPKLSLLVRIIEAFTGQKLHWLRSDELTATSAATPAASVTASPASGTPPDQPQGWGVEYELHESIHEVETTAFSAQGEIHTADGRRLQFELTLQMSREYRQTTSFSFQAGDAVRKDPLVINFGGTAAELSDRKFAFDLDADGKNDNISFVGSASGFLALDRNGNGKIDNGHELFGARTGNGFAELAAHDEDGNGWIDENDSVFAKLRIWSKDREGADHLHTLAERQVGAISLEAIATPFDLKDAQNRQHGQVLSTGVYLAENGRAGTVQQLDLFV